MEALHHVNFPEYQSVTSNEGKDNPQDQGEEFADQGGGTRILSQNGTRGKPSYALDLKVP